VLVLRDSASGPEVFMVRRHEGSGAFRGAHVFPGGRVDDHDASTADDSWCDGVDYATRQLADLSAAEALAYHVAAARELFEEAGVLLARDRAGHFVSLDDHRRFTTLRLDVHAHRKTFRSVVEDEHLRLALDALTRYAHWVTPPVEGRRFDTRFFVARVPPKQTPAHDDTETTESVWTTPAAALSSAERRAILLPPPTWTTLRELATFQSVDQVLEWAAVRHITRSEPVPLQENGSRLLLMPDGTRFVWTENHWRPEDLT